jgi:hypothetical protein
MRPWVFVIRSCASSILVISTPSSMLDIYIPQPLCFYFAFYFAVSRLVIHIPYQRNSQIELHLCPCIQKLSILLMIKQF